MTFSQKISVFGATGSIGQSTLDFLLTAPNSFEVIALTARGNGKKLAELAIKTKAKYVVIEDKSQYPVIKQMLEGKGINILCGKEGLLEVAKIPVDIVVSAIVGLAGLEVTYCAIPFCRKLALANKESIVAAGEQILSWAAQHGTKILPIDSEHSAIFQVLEESNRIYLDKLILTASGGPFRQLDQKEFVDITVENALKHPNWKMGNKITIDCATLVNKGLELMEAALLFKVPEKQIEIIVHPESIIHSLVSYQDGSTLAQLGNPDMKTAISYALSWPQRSPTTVKPLNLIEVGQLTFEEPDLKRFPALRLARQALIQGQGQRIIFNTANEVSVDYFLRDQIPFTQIPKIIEQVLERMSSPPLEGIRDILHFDQEIRHYTQERIKRREF